MVLLNTDISEYISNLINKGISLGSMKKVEKLQDEEKISLLKLADYISNQKNTEKIIIEPTNQLSNTDSDIIFIENGITNNIQLKTLVFERDQHFKLMQRGLKLVNYEIKKNQMNFFLGLISEKYYPVFQKQIDDIGNISLGIVAFPEFFLQFDKISRKIGESLDSSLSQLNDIPKANKKIIIIDITQYHLLGSNEIYNFLIKLFDIQENKDSFKDIDCIALFANQFEEGTNQKVLIQIKKNEGFNSSILFPNPIIYTYFNFAIIINGALHNEIGQKVYENTMTLDRTEEEIKLQDGSKLLLTINEEGELSINKNYICNFNNSLNYLKEINIQINKLLIENIST